MLGARSTFHALEIASPIGMPPSHAPCDGDRARPWRRCEQLSVQPVPITRAPAVVVGHASGPFGTAHHGECDERGVANHGLVRSNDKLYIIDGLVRSNDELFMIG
jgi:hypothetical protein